MKKSWKSPSEYDKIRNYISYEEIGDPATAEHYISLIDKLIITGGQHVSPQFYGAEKEIVSDDYLLERDLFELALIKEAVAAKKPIFTVCRGMQLYNVAMGGTALPRYRPPLARKSRQRS